MSKSIKANRLALIAKIEANKAKHIAETKKRNMRVRKDTIKRYQTDIKVAKQNLKAIRGGVGLITCGRNWQRRSAMTKRIAQPRTAEAPVNQDRGANFRNKDGKLYLVRCYACDPVHGTENYALNVSSGICTWCGWSEREAAKGER